MNVIKLSHSSGIMNGTIKLDGSKSISNRVLIIRALANESFKIHRLSTSDDTSKLDALLREKNLEIYDVGHAGTTFRFLTAYLSLQNGSQILTGSSRMLERPIGPLVDALRNIGCRITYMGKEGYPPLQIDSPNHDQFKSEVEIDAGISSQYITALVLIAPTLPNGLTIRLKGDMVSESYLKLTLGIVADFGIQSNYHDQIIHIPPQPYLPIDYTIEADWSASSYYYSLMAIAKSGSIKLKGLFMNSLQGDSEIQQIANMIGIESLWERDEIRLEKIAPSRKMVHNFINQPDIAQTLGVICAANNIENDFSGLKTLRIKETDRINAMNIELSRIGSSFDLIKNEKNNNHYRVSPGISFETTNPRFETYKDHRMAMSFAPLALLHPIEINQPDVVSKSYPSFWEDLRSLGFEIEEIG